jgi:hypothetical protein
LAAPTIEDATMLKNALILGALGTTGAAMFPQAADIVEKLMEEPRVSKMLANTPFADAATINANAEIPEPILLTPIEDRAYLNDQTCRHNKSFDPLRKSYGCQEKK